MLQRIRRTLWTRAGVVFGGELVLHTAVFRRDGDGQSYWARPLITSRHASFKTQRSPEEQENEFGKAGGITVSRGSKGKKPMYCFGCGADLVPGSGEAGTMNTSSKSSSKSKGSLYWAQKKDDLKKSQLKNWALCPRCKALRTLELESSKKQEQLLEQFCPNHEMTEVFRQQVSRIWRTPNAVVVLCVDAMNVNGSLLSSIRNYVGGNPILLAITRCDLLPSYIWQPEEGLSTKQNTTRIQEVFRERAKMIHPAAAYLCATDGEDTDDDNVSNQIGKDGIDCLCEDLYDNLNGRDVFVVGVANIGKSTLTDELINHFLAWGEDEFIAAERGRNRRSTRRVQRSKAEHLTLRRIQKIQESRITKSSLPGTTLQNVRVPCFVQDHEQALWDTPGLLVDQTVKQFPIPKFKTLRALRPQPIQPQIHVTEEKAIALELYYHDSASDTEVTKNEDETNLWPLLRFEVRLKKNAVGDGPIRLVWNSTLPLQSRLVDIRQARSKEEQRCRQVQDRQEATKQQQRDDESTHSENKNHVADSTMTKAERREARRQAYLERVKKEKEELGAAEWNRRQQEKKAANEALQRQQQLAELKEVHQVTLDGQNVGVDVSVANFGWLGIMTPRDAMIATFAPNTGVSVATYDTLGLPADWGPYKNYNENNNKKKKEKESLASHDKHSEDLDEDFDEDFDEDWGDYDMYNDDFDSFGSYGDIDEIESRIPKYARGDPGSASRPEKEDIWAEFSGEKIGWEFDADVRFSKTRHQDGWYPIRKEDKTR